MESTFEIFTEAIGHHTTVFVNGVLSTDTAPKLNDALLKLDYAGLDLTIDMAKTDYITSAGLRALLVARKKLSDDTMRIINANQSIIDVFAATGFDTLIKIEKSSQIGEEYRLSIAALLKKRVESDGEKTAYIYKDREYTWNEVDAASHIIADKLSAIGVKKGTHVGLCAQNSPNWIFTLFAIQKLGGIAVLINPSLLPDEVCNLSKIADVTHLCYGETEGVTSFEPYKAAFISAGAGSFAIDISDRIDFTKQFEIFGSISGKYRELYHADDPCAVIFSSGSTGAPKAIISSSYSMISGTEHILKSMPISGSDINLAFLPMFHIFGFTMGISVGLISGYCSVIPEDKIPDTMVALIDKYKCTLFSTVPTMILAMLCVPDFTPEKLKSLRISFLGGSITTEEQLLMLKKLLPNIHFCNVYGMSENSVVSITDYEDTVEHITTTVGKPVKNIKLTIRDTDGNALPEGQTGEICISSDTIAVCYYKLPIEKQPIDKEGLLATGDLGFIDSDGYLHITGRIKDLIICGGENISPGEIADVISSFPGIADVKVLGVPDKIFGEIVVAALVLKDSFIWNEDKIRAFLSSRLAEYKLPVHYVLFDSFPVLGSGKVDAIALKEAVIERLKRGDVNREKRGGF